MARTFFSRTSQQPAPRPRMRLSQRATPSASPKLRLRIRQVEKSPRNFKSRGF
jgi:hypothetical protein